MLNALFPTCDGIITLHDIIQLVVSVHSNYIITCVSHVVSQIQSHTGLNHKFFLPHLYLMPLLSTTHLDIHHGTQY